jgi:hypothetical protein
MWNIIYISPYTYRSVAYLKSAWRSYRIALDLTNESLKMPYSNKDIHIPAFETFLATVNLFDGILNGLKQMKHGEIDKIGFKDEHWNDYQTVRSKFTNWLSKELFKHHELQYMKASFFFFIINYVFNVIIIFYQLHWWCVGLSPIRSSQRL